MDRFEMDQAAIERHPGGAPFSPEHSRAPIVVGIHRPRDGDGPLADPAGRMSTWCRRARTTCGRIRPSIPSIEGDWLYGRGGADMKSGMPPTSSRSTRSRRIGLQPAATLYLQSVVEEESHRQRRADDASARLQGRRRADPRARGREAGARQYRRALVPARRARPARACARDGRPAPTPSTPPIASSASCASSRRSGTRARPAGRTSRTRSIRSTSTSARSRAATGPPRCRPGAGCIAASPSIRASRAEAAAREIASASRPSRAPIRYFANSPPQVTFHGFHAEGYVLEPGSEAEAVLGARARGGDRQASSRAS